MQKTINIHSIEYSIKEEEREKYLEIPVGYGCYGELGPKDNGLFGNVVGESTFYTYDWRELLVKDSQIEMEVTAIKYTQGAFATNSLDADTVNIELAHTKAASQNMVRLFRIKTAQQDMKTILNYNNQVAYLIDLRHGNCSLSHLIDTNEVGNRLEQDDTYKAPIEHSTIKFRNGLILNMNEFMDLLLDTNDHHFIKQMAPSARVPVARVFYESTISAQKLFGRSSSMASTANTKSTSNASAKNVAERARLVRVIQTYNEESESEMRLQGVTVWVLDALDQSLMLESYQLNVINWRRLDRPWPDYARTFDISKDCFLNDINDHMRQGKDYAWMNFKYLANSEQLDSFAKQRELLLNSFYMQMLKSVDFDFTRLPQVEASIEDDGFVMRALVLDRAPLQFVYKFVPETSVANLADVNEFAPDLEHCAKLCRLHHCTMMSFCALKNTCLTSLRQLANETERNKQLDSNDKCHTWIMPEKGMSWNTLHHLLARWQHTNMQAFAELPRLPEELGILPEESSLSSEQRISLQRTYEAQVREFMFKQGNELANELFLPMTLGEHFVYFLPCKFELQDDPLSELDVAELATSSLGANGDDDYDDDLEPEDDKVPAFHKGAPLTRLKLQFTTKSHSDNGQVVHARQLLGLTHDQCALACKDARCGVFSYCASRHDCILSSATSIGQAKRLDLTQPDIDCYLMERDFLNNYIKFSNITVPETLQIRSSQAGSASECAVKCSNQTSYVCLSFEFCSLEQQQQQQQRAPASNSDKQGVCYFQTQHHPGVVTAYAAETIAKSGRGLPMASKFDCDHYTRSYLADFNRFEYRMLAASQMARFVTSEARGLSALKCAERCVTKLTDCTGFQLCHEQPKHVGDLLVRSCTFILGRANPNDTSNVNLEAIVDEQADEVTKAGLWIDYNANCQLFALRKNSLPAHLRDLALGGLESKSELKRDKLKQKQKEASKAESGGPNDLQPKEHLSFVDVLSLYVMLTLISAAFGCAYMIVHVSPNDYVRHRADRFRITLGMDS